MEYHWDGEEWEGAIPKPQRLKEIKETDEHVTLVWPLWELVARVLRRLCPSIITNQSFKDGRTAPLLAFVQLNVM